MSFPIKTRATIAFACLLILSHSTPAQSDASAKRLERAAALIVENRLDEAEQQLTPVLRVAPNTAAALDLLGTVRAKQGRLDDAEKLFMRAVGADNQLI